MKMSSGSTSNRRTKGIRIISIQSGISDDNVVYITIPWPQREVSAIPYNLREVCIRGGGTKLKCYNKVVTEVANKI